MFGRRGTGPLFVVALTFAAGCAVPRPEPPKLVFLVSIDTLRPDHLGMYGYPLPTSPNLDRLRRDAILFREAIAQAPSTLHSHASLLTSLLPHHHGASYALSHPLPESAETLAESMLAGGYRTIGLVGGGQLDPVFGLGQGFEWYKKVFQGNQDFWPVAKLTLRWLSRHPDEPAFFFLHTYQTHHPYRAPREHLELFDEGYDGPLPADVSVDLLREINSGQRVIDAADRQHIVHTYDAEIHAMDERFGRFIAALVDRGLYDDAMIVVTSDHGEEFGEHGWMGWHSHTLYDELLRVPLLIKLPRSRHAGLEVGDVVRSIDIAPTILEMVGRDIPTAFEGRSLLPLIDGRRDRPLPAISRMDGPAETTDSIRYEGYKLWNGRLFDLRQDAAEQVDLAAAEAAVVERLEAVLRSAIEARPALTSEPVDLDGTTLEQLRALGYVN